MVTFRIQVQYNSIKSSSPSPFSMLKCLAPQTINWYNKTKDPPGIGDIMSAELFRRKKKKTVLCPEEKEELVKKITTFIRKRSNAAFAYIYGSFLEDDGFSDIDIALYFHRKNLPVEGGIINLEIQMEAELQKEFGHLFDVRIINHAPVSFCYNVLKNGKLIYTGDDDLRVNFFTATVKKYIDFLPYRKRYLREVLGLEV